MQKIGVTGIIGSGKSTVGKLLQESGYPVLDADKAVHQLYETSSLLKQKLVDTFGESILESNAISRKNLASIVFQNQTALKQLENIDCISTTLDVLKLVKSSDVRFEQL